MFPLPFRRCKRIHRRVLPAKCVAQTETAASRRCGRSIKDAGRLRRSASFDQLRRVSTKFWPAWLVQLSWLIETSRQLKAIGDWRISDVPLISIEVWLVIR